MSADRRLASFLYSQATAWPRISATLSRCQYPSPVDHVPVLADRQRRGALDLFKHFGAACTTLVSKEK
jgi:hypothetical protein